MLLGILCCSHPVPSAPIPNPSPTAAPRGGREDTTAGADVDASVRDGALLVAAADADGRPHLRDAPRLSSDEIADVLLLPGDPRPACETSERAPRVHCLIAARFASDMSAAKIATDLFDRTGDVAGVLAPETMEGGFRGKLHLVPALPIGKERAHLEWVNAAARDFDAFFDGLARASPGTPRYVWRGLAIRFMRSVAARTPSAYASGWTIAYNVDGSLNKSSDAVRELLFHENFHLNDEDHGDWSVHALRALYDGILAECGTRMRCLGPFTPTDMTVIGGTYYAFQPDNGDGVREYAAELALRYYREQRAVLRHSPSPNRFKCGREENAHAWKLLVDEFFGGIDLTPACQG
jgi:hypothetical protein